MQAAAEADARGDRSSASAPRRRRSSSRSTRAPAARRPTCASRPTTTSRRSATGRRPRSPGSARRPTSGSPHRKSRLERELEEHAARIEREIERVQARSTASRPRWPRSSSASSPRTIRPASPRWPRACPSRRPERRRRLGRPTSRPAVAVATPPVAALGARSEPVVATSRRRPPSRAPPRRRRSPRPRPPTAEAPEPRRPGRGRRRPRAARPRRASRPPEPLDPRVDGPRPDARLRRRRGRGARHRRSATAPTTSSGEEIPALDDETIAARLAGLPQPAARRPPASRSRPRSSSPAWSASPASPASSATSAALAGRPVGRRVVRAGRRVRLHGRRTARRSALRDAIPTLPGLRRPDHPSRARACSTSPRTIPRPTPSPLDPRRTRCPVPPSSSPYRRRRPRPSRPSCSGAGFEPIAVGHPDQLEALLRERRDIAVAILDGETRLRPVARVLQPAPRRGAGHPGPDGRLAARPRPPDGRRRIGRRRVLHAAVLGRVDPLAGRGDVHPVAQTVDDGSGAESCPATSPASADWAAKATVHRRLQPQGRRRQDDRRHQPRGRAPGPRGDQRVLLVDADTVTGHVLSSLGPRRGPDRGRQLARRDRDRRAGTAARPARRGAPQRDARGGPDRQPAPRRRPRSRARAAAASSRPAARSTSSSIDLHPSYSALNQAIFGIADRILVPVTPDVPALRAAVQLRDVAADLGIRERLSMVVNRANSGVSVDDMERAVGMPALVAHPVRRPALRPGRQRGPDRRSTCSPRRR